MSLRAVAAVNVQVGKEGDASVHHVSGPGDDTGAAAEACQPVTQAAMGALGGDGHVLALIVKADRELALVDDVVVGTEEADTPAFQASEQLSEGDGVTTATFPVDQTTGLVIDGGPDPQLIGLAAEIMPHLVHHDDHDCPRRGFGADRVDEVAHPPEDRMGARSQQLSDGPERGAVTV
jgi:hypothetical protein